MIIIKKHHWPKGPIVKKNNGTRRRVFFQPIISLSYISINGGLIILPDSYKKNLCNIFSNTASFGSDLSAENSFNITVAVDTFTVKTPTNHHAYPVNNFHFDILSAKVEQARADLYVNPAGSNENSGLSPLAPLQSIWFAYSKLLADSF